MDEKKVREAIKAMENQIAIIQKIPEYLGLKEKTDKQIEERQTAIEALKRQFPKKAIIKAKKEVPQTHNLGRLLRFHCPNCGKFIVAIYESDTERGGGISNSLKGCSTCLQAIDFSEYYSKRNVDSDKLNEELQWDD